MGSMAGWIGLLAAACCGLFAQQDQTALAGAAWLVGVVAFVVYVAVPRDEFSDLDEG